MEHKAKYSLSICLNGVNDTIKGMYRNQIITLMDKKQNNDCNIKHLDSGFDLFIPIEGVQHGSLTTINHKIQCAVYRNGEPSAYYLYPRSSISKTPFIMANSVGIIDSGYRGDIISKIHNLYHAKEEGDYKFINGLRLFQLCTPTLEPWDSIEIVDNLDNTERGGGGFGSTG